MKKPTTHITTHAHDHAPHHTLDALAIARAMTTNADLDTPLQAKVGILRQKNNEISQQYLQLVAQHQRLTFTNDSLRNEIKLNTETHEKRMNLLRVERDKAISKYCLMRDLRTQTISENVRLCALVRALSDQVETAQDDARAARSLKYIWVFALTLIALVAAAVFGGGV